MITIHNNIDNNIVVTQAITYKYTIIIRTQWNIYYLLQLKQLIMIVKQFILFSC